MKSHTLTLSEAVRICLMVGMGVFLYFNAAAQDQTQALEAPEKAKTESAQSSTTPQAPSKASDPLKSLEDAMGATFKSFSGKTGGSTGPLPRPTFRVIAPKQSQDEALKRREWMFLTPEELMGLSKDKDRNESKTSGRGTGEKAGEDLTPMQRYYLRQTLKPADLQGSLAPKSANDTGAGGNRNLPGGLLSPQDTPTLDGAKEASRSRRANGLGSWDDSSSPFASHSVVSDFFSGTSDKNLSPADIKAHEDYMQRYRDVLNSSAASSSSITPLPGYGGNNSSFTTTTTLRRPDGYDAAQGRVSSTYIPTAPDVNARALSQWNMTQSTPKAPAPTVSSRPPISTLNPTIPKRAFQ
jgi:hypothetical protein